MIIRRAKLGDMPGINDLLRQVLEVHRKGRPDLFKGGAKKYKDDELTEIISDGKRPIFVRQTKFTKNADSCRKRWAWS